MEHETYEEECEEYEVFEEPTWIGHPTNNFW